MQETLVKYHCQKNFSAEAVQCLKAKGKVKLSISLHLILQYFECFRTLASYKSGKRTHFKAKLDAKDQFFNKIYCLILFPIKNIILNLEESVNFFSIWPGIAPYLCNDCAVKVIKYTIFNFPSLKLSTTVD